MKSVLKSICSFLESVSKARAAAELSRNGKWKQAQALYED
jgi:hypothetical protein